MCGIIAAIAKRDVVPILLEGLSKLEYRGYDSAGLAVINNNKFLLKKTIKKITDLRDLVKKNNVHGNIGIAHTRWATHGKPSEANAHPLIVNNIAIVHNGIIENHEILKETIKAKYKIKFNSDTDSEVIAAKIYCYRKQGLGLLDAVIHTCKELNGAYALAVLDVNNNQEIIAARSGSPLVLGVGLDEYFLASDYLALQNLTRDLIYLKDGDVAKISKTGIEIYDLAKKKVKRKKISITTTQDLVNKGQYRHFMQKEIFEQPQAVAATIEGRIAKDHVLDAFLGDNKNIINKCKNIQIIACGTSYYAGLIAKYWFEEFAGIHCQVDISSEFRYRNKVILEDSLIITISQSGETADTLAALKNAIDFKDINNNKYCGFLAICNVPESSLVRLSNLVALTQAGIEIGVASTKAFTSQLTVILMLLAIFLKKNNNKTSLNFNNNIIKELNSLSKTLEKFLKLSDQIKLIAKKFEHKKSALFLARGLLFPLALEGALKLKELSYIHAEAFPAGELKHGPLALVDDEMPVIVLMSNDSLVEKLKSNIQEVLSRGGDLIIFADQAIKWKTKQALNIIELPNVPDWLAPIAYAIPMQLLAYHVAVLKGTDVDQPRNLAKSVTVE